MSARERTAHPMPSQGRFLSGWTPVAGGLALLASLCLAVVGRAVESRYLAQEFRKHAHAAGEAIQEAMESEVVLLQALRGLYAASREVDRDEFSIFLREGLAMPSFLSAVQWAPRVSREERETFEAAAAAQQAGFRIFEVNDLGQPVPAAERPEYFPLLYVESEGPFSEARGLDLAFEVRRRRALETARDTDRAVATEPVELVGDVGENRAGYLLVLPVYRNGVPHDSQAQRREYLTGYLLAVVSLSRLAQQSLAAVPGQAFISAGLAQGEAARPRTLGAADASPQQTGWVERLSGPGRLSETIAWTHGGQDWTLTCEATEVFYQKPYRNEPRIALALALALVWLLFILILRAGRQRRAVEIQVQERTKALQREVAERVRAEQALQSNRAELHDQAMTLEARNLALRRQETITQSLLEDTQSANERLADRERSLQDANRRLQELAVLKDEFVAKVSHELRTPLTSIKEGLNLLLDNALGETTADQRDFLSTMDQDIDRLTDLISNMLDIAKIEAGRMRLARRRLGLHEVVSAVVPSIQRLAGGRTIQVDGPTDLETYGDRNRLIQVLSNLLSNAVKFTPEDGRITVRALRLGGEVGFAVQDTGAGMAPEDLARLFQKFSQVGPQDPARPRGTGLGLVVCKELVELHGGRIEVESEPGRGTTFTVRLPVYSDEHALAATFRELRLMAESEGRGVALVLMNAEGTGARLPECERLAEAARQHLHRGDVVLTLRPAWVAILAVTEPDGIGAIVRRLDAALARPGLRWGAALSPRDGMTVGTLFARAARTLGRGADVATAAVGADGGQPTGPLA